MIGNSKYFHLPLCILYIKLTKTKGLIAEEI